MSIYLVTGVTSRVYIVLIEAEQITESINFLKPY